MKICPICGKVHNNLASDMCYKHLSQIKKYGKIINNSARTVFDPNEVRILNDYCEVDTYDKFGNILKTFKFDKEDLPIIYKYKWQCVTKGKSIRSFYLVTTINKERVYFHRLILGNPIGEIDHINIDSTDNRKTNLRISTRSNQLLNTRKRNGVSKYKGVYFSKHRKNNKWHAELSVLNKRYYSPWYKTEEEAIFARYIMEQRFAPEVFQDEYVRNQSISKLTEDEKQSIIKCLSKKWKH